MTTESTALEIICQNIGWSATLRLAVEYAGKRIYIPEVATIEHRFHKKLGERAFKQLVALHGGESVYIPECAAAQRLGMSKAARRLRSANFSLWFVSVFLDVSERQVSMLLDIADPVDQESETMQPLPENVRKMLSAGIEHPTDDACKHW